MMCPRDLSSMSRPSCLTSATTRCALESRSGFASPRRVGWPQDDLRRITGRRTRCAHRSVAAARAQHCSGPGPNEHLGARALSPRRLPVLPQIPRRCESPWRSWRTGSRMVNRRGMGRRACSLMPARARNPQRCSRSSPSRIWLLVQHPPIPVAPGVRPLTPIIVERRYLAA
jgi:hypothetical protein